MCILQYKPIGGCSSLSSPSIRRHPRHGTPDRSDGPPVGLTCTDDFTESRRRIWIRVFPERRWRLRGFTQSRRRIRGFAESHRTWTWTRAWTQAVWICEQLLFFESVGAGRRTRRRRRRKARRERGSFVGWRGCDAERTGERGPSSMIVGVPAREKKNRIRCYGGFELLQQYADRGKKKKKTGASSSSLFFIFSKFVFDKKKKERPAGHAMSSVLFKAIHSSTVAVVLYDRFSFFSKIRICHTRSRSNQSNPTPFFFRGCTPKAQAKSCLCFSGVYRVYSLG